jgi:hypothetical protein
MRSPAICPRSFSCSRRQQAWRGITDVVNEEDEGAPVSRIGTRQQRRSSEGNLSSKWGSVQEGMLTSAPTAGGAGIASGAQPGARDARQTLSAWGSVREIVLNKSATTVPRRGGSLGTIDHVRASHVNLNKNSKTDMGAFVQRAMSRDRLKNPQRAKMVGICSYPPLFLLIQ